jgi:excisionase family DNA binding protein
MIEYLSVTQFCQKYGMDNGNVRRLISQGRIPAIKIGNQWAIPADAEPPADKRVKTGKYRNWRNKEKRSAYETETDQG